MDILDSDQSEELPLTIVTFNKDPDGDKDHKVKEAEVLFIAPRHLNKGIKMVEPIARKNALSGNDENLDERH